MADDRKYYVLCADDCKFEGMTKEQILAAIAEATGATVTDIDNAFISKIKEINKGETVQIWVGTTAEYNAIVANGEKRSDVIYIITDDARIAEIEKSFEATTEALQEQIDEGLKAFYNLAANKGITKIYNLSVDLDTMALSFTGNQTANELFNDLENKQDVLVIATAANGTRLYIEPIIKTGGINSYSFECNTLSAFEVYYWGFLKTGFTDCIKYNIYNVFQKGFQRVLTADDDLDEIFDDGVYVYSTSSVPANAPFENAAVIEVFGADSTTTQKIQRAYRYGEAGHSAFRPLYSGAWGAWTKNLIIKTATVKKTTNENGNTQLTTDKSKSVVILAYAMSEDGKTGYTAHIYASPSYGGWWCHLMDISTSSAAASKTVNVTYYYIEL